ncbi:hypothetical protein FB446DRAFT_768539 [Lentinula raphanica]|nr:hypothetical protein FB446DRAFT_768539 [Lentinula raphanica]
MSLASDPHPYPHSSSRYTSEIGSSLDFWEDLKDESRFKLKGHIWQFTVDQLAHALSAKTRNQDVSPLAPGYFDSVDDYAVCIDEYGSEIKMACQEFVFQAPEVLLVSGGDNYRDVVGLLNKGIEVCLAQLSKDRDVFYRDLKFCVWDKPMKDGVGGPESPHGAGIKGFGNSVPDQLFWSPPDEGGMQMAIPVEVNEDWQELVLQAGTNACYLFSASPLRQFALVIGYNRKDHNLRFLVFHRGGCTASVPLDLDEVPGQEGFIRLLFSIFTWRTRADAGFAAWCNNAQVCLPLLQNEARNMAPFIVDIDRVLHQTFCVRGRSPRVFCLKVPGACQKRPVANLMPATHMRLRRSSSRTRENEGKTAAKKVSNTSSHVDQHCSDTTRAGNAPSDSRKSQKREINKDKGWSSSNMSFTEVVPSSLNPAHASDHQLKNTNLHIHWPSLKFDSLQRSDFNNTVMKLCWTPDRGSKHGPIEPDFLRDCSNMFGVPKHLYSFQVYHDIGSPTTNHLFLPPPSDDLEQYRWHVLGKPIIEKPDRRSLLGHIMIFAGHSLLTARDFPSLIRAILHALIGYYNMCQKNYQHCDLSIDNVLMVDEPITTQPFRIENPNPIQQEILNLCKTLAINDRCYGFVIDGDMAVHWDTYFEDEDVGTKTGTSEFMSDWLFNQMLNNHLHSPLDDFASLYFVTQWACVFREVPQEERSQCESAVREWRTDLAGDVRQRGFVTLQINHEKLRANQYGEFLVQAQPFLKQCMCFPELRISFPMWTKFEGWTFGKIEPPAGRDKILLNGNDPGYQYPIDAVIKPAA